MEEVPLFHVKNLACAYKDSKNIVLKIKELIIPRNKLIFLLGASGSGKSTLLETLGLMNNTIREGSIVFKPTSEKSLNLENSWKQGEQEINLLRKEHFTFIFQQTNLMENFTSYENVCMSEMIKTGATLDSAVHKAEILMERVRLPKSEVTLEKLPKFLSGGQRQRLSFVRALNNNADVIFCDEPTGNLDETNANELFEVIKDEIKQNKTAIVVSHDINLAIKHADVIIVLNKNQDGIGEIQVSNVFEKPMWANFNEHEKLSFKECIRSVFVTKENIIKTENEVKSNINLNLIYRSLLSKRETQVLNGIKKSNLVILSLIFFFTFLAVGFANGSLNYLFEKMNSALVNWVSIPVPASKSADKEYVDNLFKILNTPSNKLQYGYSVVSKYAKDSKPIYDKNIQRGARRRTVDVSLDSKFINEEILGQNLILGDKSGFKNNQDFSVIVSKQFLSDFNYPEDAFFILMNIDDADTSNGTSVSQKIPIPIKAIVNDLPSKLCYLIPIDVYSAFYNDNRILSGQGTKPFSYVNERKYIYGFIGTRDSSAKEQVKQDLSKALDLSKSQFNYSYQIKADKMGYLNGLSFEISLEYPVQHYTELDKIWSQISTASSISKYSKDLVRNYNFEGFDYTFNSDFDEFSVYFTSLEKVEEFKNFIESLNRKDDKQTDMIEMDISKVREKKNFLFLSLVSKITSVLLIIFSAISVSLFLYNLVKNHLNKVKMNIGTFKAIGLSDSKTTGIYFGIIVKFVLVGLLLGLGTAFLIGSVLNSFLISNFQSDVGMKYFILLGLNTYITVGVVLVLSLLVSWYTIRKILSKSPGDLIYNR